MIILNGTTSKLQLVTSQATSVHVLISYADYTGGNDLLTIGSVPTAISTATTTDICPAPAAGVKREIRSIMMHNTGGSNGFVIFQNENGTQYELYDCVTNTDEKVEFNRDIGFKRLNKRGVEITEASEPTYPIKTHTFYIQKNSVGTSEAAGIYHFMGTGAGLPGTWAIGTSGLSGRAVLKSEAGFLKLPTTSNKLVLVNNGLRSSASNIGLQLVDVLLVNNGIVVTTTTAQTLNTVALPARDNEGGTNGIGCLWGLLVTTATTNAGAITNMTISYTNQDGTAGRTGTVASFPATAALGSFIPFTPQSGDYGIRSIQSITLGTTLTAGAVSVVCMRVIDSAFPPSSNVTDYFSSNRKIAISGNEALTVMLMAQGATAYSIPNSEILINEY